MRYLVTGAAGFIGSYLCEALLSEGDEVIGLDAFIPYYPREVKEHNLRGLLDHPHFTFYECDLRTDNLMHSLEGVNVVYHIAAMPGLLVSWVNFDLYMTCNIQATQRLLEAVKQQGRVEQFIYASTSSVYGEYVVGPETSPLNPVSPYGITKLAGEHLVQTYDHQFGLPSTILRYFSVYGPRQRPDMGYYIFIDKILRGEQITIFGDGSQRRGNTYVTDVAQATASASKNFQRGQVYNIGGVEEVSANEIIALLEEITDSKANIVYGPDRKGEQSRTIADITRARENLGFYPTVSLRDGLTAQVNWQKELLGVQ